jgi:hypothetical protein
MLRAGAVLAPHPIAFTDSACGSYRDSFLITDRRARLMGRIPDTVHYQEAEKSVFAQAAQKGPDARRRAMRGGRRTLSVRRSAARARGYPPKVGLRRWVFFSGLLGLSEALASVAGTSI